MRIQRIHQRRDRVFLGHHVYGEAETAGRAGGDRPQASHADAGQIGGIPAFGRQARKQVAHRGRAGEGDGVHLASGLSYGASTGVQIELWSISDDGIVQVKKLLDEIEAALPRTLGTSGVIVTDQQTLRVVRVLRILTDQVEQLREQAP